MRAKLRIWALVSGSVSSVLGLLGLSVCCLPILGGVAAVFGSFLVVVHQGAQGVFILGVVMISIGIAISIKSTKKCCK